SNIYLCAASYVTSDGGGLAAQCPAGTGPNIEPGEFFVIPTIALRDHNADGKFDRLDPALDFTFRGSQQTSQRYILEWSTMPGRAYQLISAATLDGVWSNIAGSLTTAGPLQLDL